MPRVVLATTGSLGDVFPFIAIALALRAQGVDPVLAAMPEYAPLAAAEGLAFHPVRPGGAEMLAAGYDEHRAVRAVIDDVGATFDLILPHLDASFADTAAAIVDADFVICSSFAIAARAAAEAAGIPVATVLFQPIAFCSRVDPPVIGQAPLPPAMQRRLPPAVVRGLYALARRRFAARRRPVDALRARLGLPAQADALIEGPLRTAQLFALYPPAFAPLATDAPAFARSTGFSFYNGANAAQDLAPDLADFLETGPPPLVFTLGSLAVHAPGDFYETSAAAARAAGRRAILLVGDHAAARLASLAGADIAVVGFAPHAALFPRAAAVVHHGGIGTTAQALRAGVPQLVCPVLGDQFDNAERLRELGVARVVRLTRYAGRRATRAIAELLADETMASRAGALGPAMTQVDGPAAVARAVANRIAGRPPA